MHQLNIHLLKKICELPGAPGFEDRIRNFLINELEGVADKIDIDNMGNLYAVKEAKDKNARTVMVTAHMDEIGFIVNHIDDNGFVRFHPLGGFDPKTLTAQRVIIHGKEDVMGVMGTKPVHVMPAEERTKMPKISDFFIDLGMEKEAVEKLISIGDPITRERELIEMGQCINCKSIDNRISVFILLEAFRQLMNVKVPYHIYAVFTVQEEVGLRGAVVAAHNINPDFGINLDTTIAYDVPGSQPQEQVTKLGNGTAIKIMDSSVICDRRMVDYLKMMANQNNIPWQAEILPAGGTDTASLQRNGKSGSISGAISIPTRHLHQVIEMAHQDDVYNSIRLLKIAIQNLDQYNWQW